MMRVPSRPLLGLLALLRAGAVFMITGLIGVGIVAYLPQYAPLGEVMITIGGALGFLVFCGVVAGGIVHEHERVDAQERRNAEKLDLEYDRLRLALEQARAAVVSAVLSTDDDEQLDTADLPKLERERAFQVAHWHVFFQRLVPAGEAYGWDIRTLTAPTSPFKVTTAPGWNNGTDALVKAGYMAKDKTGTRLLVSVADWKAERLWLNVPCPPGEPPDILPPPYTAINTTENNRKTAAGAVVEGVAREVGK